MKHYKAASNPKRTLCGLRAMYAHKADHDKRVDCPACRQKARLANRAFFNAHNYTRCLPYFDYGKILRTVVLLAVAVAALRAPQATALTLTPKQKTHVALVNMTLAHVADCITTERFLHNTTLQDVNPAIRESRSLVITVATSYVLALLHAKFVCKTQREKQVVYNSLALAHWSYAVHNQRMLSVHF